MILALEKRLRPITNFIQYHIQNLKLFKLLLLFFVIKIKINQTLMNQKKEKRRREYYSVSKLFVVKGRQPFDLVSLSLISPASVNHTQHYIVICSN